jgi:hypothetical protein
MVAAFEAEYRRYRALAEGALSQVDDNSLKEPAPGGGNSLATLVQHVAGNLLSRFTDFLVSDGEKPWRGREAEFVDRGASRAELDAFWLEGWAALEGALECLADGDLGRAVTIRGQPLTVREALVRSLAHTSNHVGQMVLLARSVKGNAWRFLSIAPGASAEYNKAPNREKPPRTVPASQEEIVARIVKAFDGPCWHGPALTEILDGVDAKTARARPALGVHSIAEQVRHIIYWAEDTRLRFEGAQPQHPELEADWPTVEILGDAHWHKLVEQLRIAHVNLAEVVRAYPRTRLAEIVPGCKVTFEIMAIGIPEHAAYHGGQIALLKRMLRS